MHWGLRAFERKRIERIALDHPYFDMHAPLLTKKELRTILAQSPHKTGPQVVAEVKKELGIAFTPVTQEKRTLAEALRDASFVPSFRRAVVLSVFCLLLALFMTFTVPGRAFAEEVYSIIINLVDGMLNARNSIPYQSQQAPDFSSLPADIKTPQELSTYLDYPVFRSNETLSLFEYDTDTPEVLSIFSKYQTENGGSFTISQDVYGPNISWSVSIDANNDMKETIMLSGIKLYLNRASDATVYAIGFSETYSLCISSCDLSQDLFFLILQDITTG